MIGSVWPIHSDPVLIWLSATLLKTPLSMTG
jgi:hypothetical protein